MSNIKWLLSKMKMSLKVSTISSKYCVGGPQHETWIRNIKSLTFFSHFFRFYQIFSVSFLVWLGFSAIIPSQSYLFRIYMNIIIYMSHLALLKINLNYFIFQISFNKLLKIWKKNIIIRPLMSLSLYIL